jgi:methanethiol oxidase
MMQPLRGGPQMVEVSRDGKRILFQQFSLLRMGEQFYPAGVGSWMVKLDAAPEGGIEFDNKFFMQPDDYRIHQIRLEGATRPPTRSAIRE